MNTAYRKTSLPFDLDLISNLEYMLDIKLMPDITFYQPVSTKTLFSKI